MVEVGFIRDLMLKMIDYVTEQGAEFADFRLEVINGTSFSVLDGVVKEATSGDVAGLAIRVLYGGRWGFSTTNDLSLEGIKRATESALVAAKASAQAGIGEGSKVYLLNPLKDDVKVDVKVDPRDVSLSDKVRDALELYKLVSTEEFVKSVTIHYADGIGTTVYVSSDGRDILQESCLTWLYVWVVGSEAGVSASVRDELGSTDGYTIWEKWGKDEISSKLINRLKSQLRAKTPKGGNYPAVLAPEVVGVFVHEAFGHLSEADLTLSGSAIKDKLGSKIASEYVTIVDDPTIPNGFGTFKYDDEGVETRPAYLIENGVIKELMVNREYAAKLGVRPTGNARAESYKVPPIIRMRNTVMKPRDYSFEELIEDIKFGYYLVSFRGGQANLDGTFQVGIQEAYEIVNGEIKEPVRNMSISGNTLETLALVDAVGKDFEITYGRCGKGQTAFVSDGGPHVRVKYITIGGEA